MPLARMTAILVSTTLLWAHPALTAQPQIKAKGLEMPKQPEILTYSAPSDVTGEPEITGTTVTKDEGEVGRNQLCPCGSGKKYKRCHGAPGGPSGLTARING